MKHIHIFAIFFANCLLPTAYCFSQVAWTHKANFGGGTARKYAVGFSIGAKEYIGTGQSVLQLSGFLEI